MGTEESLIDHDEENDLSRIKLELEWQIQHTQHLEGLRILAGGIGHDLNNLLMTIVGNTDLILQHVDDKSRRTKSIGRIREAAGKASELTHQILSYIGSGSTVLEIINLKKIIVDTERMLRLPAEKMAILLFDLDDVPLIDADVSQIISLIMNMITNASGITCSKHGRVGISLKCISMVREELDELFRYSGRPEGEYIHLKVSDMGCDLDKDQITNMFGPFFQKQITGNGNRMATALELVSNQNGEISVEFDEKGERSISAYFPRADLLRDRLSSSEPVQKKAVSKRSVLLVDDNSSVLETAGEMLEGLGHSVITAKDGFEAVEIFKSAEYEVDCVILDLSMPEMDGTQTFTILRGLRPNVPVILSSGYSRADVIGNSSYKRFNGFLEKPYDIVRLQDILENVFNQ